MPSGSAINVAMTVSKLSGKAIVVGQVGDDNFGVYVNKILLKNNINTDNLTKLGNTSLKFITSEDKAEVIIGQCGDYKLEIKKEKIDKDDIIHFSSALAFSNNNLKENYYELLKEAKAQGAYVSFDPNYRSGLINKENLENFCKECWVFMKQANCVKLSLEEALILTNTNKLEKAIAQILEKKLETVFINIGERGTVFFNNDQFVQIPTISVNKENFSGVGDAFIGAILYKLANSEYRNFNMEEWKETARFANKVGALICKTKGGIMSISKIDNVY